MSSSHLPKVTFGIIVFNGEPFTRYCLRALYPYAHEIIVVEGACPGSAELATSDGHSTDGTLEVLKEFKSQEDPENKLQLVFRDGLWPEKDEQSQAYAGRATGDYLWQVDIDEFYKPEDMQTVLRMLKDDPAITAVSFKQITFWGGFDYVTDGWYLRNGAAIYHRLFKWRPGYTYVTHRPPTVQDEQGRDLRNLRWVTAGSLTRQGIFLYHYSLVFPKLVTEKCEYYEKSEWAQRRDARKWAVEVFLELREPYRVHNIYIHPSWLERFSGTHPPEIEKLRSELSSKFPQIEQRRTEDIENLLHSLPYAAGRGILKMGLPVSRILKPFWQRLRYALKHPLGTLAKPFRKSVQ